MGRMRSLILLLTLAVPVPGSAQSPSPGSDRILIYVYGKWSAPYGGRNAVKTKSGSWMPFPPDGMAIEGQITCAGAAAVRLPRERQDEIRRIVEDEIPPHRWHVRDEEKLTSLPPHIHEWGCAKF